MDPIAVLECATSWVVKGDYLPLAFAVMTHMMLGMLWYGPLFGRLFMALAHPEGIDHSKDDSPWLYICAMSGAVVSNLCIHAVVVATHAQNDIASMTAIALAVLLIDFNANIRQPLFELRPIQLMLIHQIYHASAAAMAVFYFSFMSGTSAEDSGATPLIEMPGLVSFNCYRVALAALIWNVMGMLWYGVLCREEFTVLAFPDKTAAQLQQLAAKPSSAMLVSNLGSIVVGLVLDRTVAVASALAPGMADSELSVAVKAVVLVIGWSAAAHIAHPGFEHRSLRLWLLHQAHHLTAGAVIATAFVVGHTQFPAYL